MKQYPSIPNSNGTAYEDLGQVHIYDKLDGNNMRFEYSAKKGWHKFGTRTQVIGLDDPTYGPAVKQFLVSGISFTMPGLIKAQIGKSVDEMTAFFEWHGPNSFAGKHQEGDKMRLSLLDVTVNKKGFLSQKHFIKAFLYETDIPNYFGLYKVTDNFVDSVVNSNKLGTTFEGVVAKTQGKGDQVLRTKIKTKAWKEKIYATYPPEIAERYLNS